MTKQCENNEYLENKQKLKIKKEEGARQKSMEKQTAHLQLYMYISKKAHLETISRSPFCQTHFIFFFFFFFFFFFSFFLTQ